MSKKDLFKNFLSGKLDQRQLRELEKHSLDDDFLADALEGYTVYEQSDRQAAFSILKERLNRLFRDLPVQ